MSNLSIDDGGGKSFSGGYDVNTSTYSGLEVEVPNTGGCWRMNGNFYVHVTEKPSWFHRKMTKLLLGWIWIDT